MRFTLLILILLSSCASKPKTSLLGLLAKDPQASMQSHPAKSRMDAKRIIQNRQNYLRILFEQSVDPYYGKPKWSDECLSANRIGSIEEAKESIVLWSQLILKDQKEGFCPGDKEAKASHVLMVYCEGSGTVQEYKFSAEIQFNLKEIQFCSIR